MKVKEFKKSVKINDLHKINLYALKSLHSATECPMCKYKTDGILKKTPSEFSPIEINVDFAVHYQQTHGVPMIFLADLIAKELFNDEKLKKQFIDKYQFLDKL